MSKRHEQEIWARYIWATDMSIEQETWARDIIKRHERATWARDRRLSKLVVVFCHSESVISVIHSCRGVPFSYRQHGSVPEPPPSHCMLCFVLLYCNIKKLVNCLFSAKSLRRGFLIYRKSEKGSGVWYEERCSHVVMYEKMRKCSVKLYSDMYFTKKLSLSRYETEIICFLKCKNITGEKCINISALL